MGHCTWSGHNCPPAAAEGSIIAVVNGQEPVNYPGYLFNLQRINGSTRWPMFCKYLSLSRNALVVIGGCLLAYVLQQTSGQIPFAVTGQVASGLPPFQLPPFETQVNGTMIGFSGMLSQLGSSLIAIPVIAILESIAIAKAFSE